jgi:dTDP-4-dehydrorhamnose 3,5-epimerase
MMQVEKTFIDGLVVLNPEVFGDERGFFYESFNLKVFHELISPDSLFVQDNHSMSSKGILRGLHYQHQNPQGKLVRATKGKIYDVAIDLRKRSSTFGKHLGVILSAENKKQLWVPKGFAHGFLVLSETAEVNYKTSDYYRPDDEYSIRWNDPHLAISWPALDCNYKLSSKDSSALNFNEVPHFGEE